MKAYFCFLLSGILCINFSTGQTNSKLDEPTTAALEARINQSIQISSSGVLTNDIVIMDSDTLFETTTICEGGVVLLPWNGFPVTDPGLYCYEDSIFMETRCLEIILIPTITTEYDTMICPNGIVTPGTYLYVLTSTMGCDSIVILHVFSCTAVEDMALESAIRVYPNPATHTVSIACEQGKYIGSQFELIDVNGTVIKQGMINHDQTEIPVSSFTSGITLIKITNGRHSIVKRILTLPD